MASTTTKSIILVCTKPGATTPTCDPALDLDAPGIVELISAHLRKRDDATREALPIKPGARAFVWKVARLSRAALAWCDGEENVSIRYQYAVLAGMHEFSDADGVRHVAQVEKGQFGINIANDAWGDEVYDLIGQGGIDELGGVILDWSRVGARELAPFALSRGLRLAR